MGKAELAEALMAIRSDAYRHLREVAARGWSFWDIFSFHERMARLRATGPSRAAGRRFVVISF